MARLCAWAVAAPVVLEAADDGDDMMGNVASTAAASAAGQRLTSLFAELDAAVQTLFTSKMIGGTRTTQALGSWDEGGPVICGWRECMPKRDLPHRHSPPFAIVMAGSNERTTVQKITNAVVEVLAIVCGDSA